MGKFCPNYDYWSVAVLTVTEHLFPLLILFQIGCFLHWIESVYPHLFCSIYDNGSPLYLWSPSGLLCWWIFIVPEVVLNLVYLSIFSGLAALMSADIARNLWLLVCSCLNSYWTFHLFPLLILFQIGCFLHWIESVYPHLFCSIYDNGSPLYMGLFWENFVPFIGFPYKWNFAPILGHNFGSSDTHIHLQSR